MNIMINVNIFFYFYIYNYKIYSIFLVSSKIDDEEQKCSDCKQQIFFLYK